MKDGETYSDNFSRLLVIVNCLKSNGGSIEDIHVVEKILRSLANKFEHVVVPIEESKDLETLSIEELIRFLQVYEKRMEKNSSFVIIEQALDSKLNLTEEKPNGFHGGYTNSNHGKGRGRKTFRGRSPCGRGGNINIQCFNCNKFEHYALDCWYNKSEEHSEQSNLVEASNVEKEECTLLFAQKEENNSQDVWYLDFGASNHMSGKKEPFVELVEGIQGDVHLGNSSKLPIKGKGKIRICQRTGILQFISNVYYMSNFR